MRPLTMILAASLGAAPLAAQKPTPAQKLDRLLRELQQLPRAAWQQRVAELEKQIAAHRKKAGTLRGEAARIQQRAAGEDAKAKALTGRIQRLRSMLALIGAKAMPKAVAKKPTPKRKTKPKPKPNTKPTPKRKTKPKPNTKPKPKPKAKPPAKSKAKPMPAAKTVKKAPPRQLVTWDRQVGDLFDSHCAVCHDTGDASGGLDLSSFAAALAGGGSGRTIVPFQPQQSRLYRLMTHGERPFMPKDADKLSDPQLQLVRDWIASGAPENDEDARKKLAELEKRRAARRRSKETRPRGKGPVPMPDALPEVALATVVRAPPVKTLAVSPVAPLVAVAGHGQVLLYHARSLARLGVLAFPHGSVEAIRFSDDGRLLLVAGGRAGRQGRATLFEVETGKPLRTFGPERDTVLAAAVRPGGRMIALGGPSRRVRVYDARTGQRLYEVTRHKEWVLSLDFNRDGSRLCSADRGGGVIVSIADDGRHVADLGGHPGAVHVARFTRDGRAVITGASDGRLRAFVAEDGRSASNQAAHGGALLALATSPDGTGVTGGVDGRLRLWRKDGRPGRQLPRAGDWVNGLAYSADGARLFAGDGRGRLLVYSVKDAKLLRTLVPATGTPRQ